MSIIVNDPLRLLFSTLSLCTVPHECAALIRMSVFEPCCAIGHFETSCGQFRCEVLSSILTSFFNILLGFYNMEDIIMHPEDIWRI